MPGVANYTGGSLHRLVAARHQHPDRAGQKRYFAERRLGIPLSSSVAAAAGGQAAERERKRAEISLSFAAPKDAAGTAERSSLQERTSKDGNDEEGRLEKLKRRHKDDLAPDRTSKDGKRPVKKVKMSAILQAVDDDPVLSLDLHREKLLAEDNWAGLHIKVELPPPVVPSQPRPQAQATEGSPKMDVPRPKALPRSAADDSSFVAVVTEANVLLHSSRDGLDPELESADWIDERPPPLGTEDVRSANKAYNPPAPPAAYPNLERLDSPPASDHLSTPTTLVDNPRSLFSVVASARATLEAAPVTPATAHLLAPTHTLSSRTTARPTAPRKNVSVTEHILAGREPLRAGLATIALSFPTDRRGVARPKADDRANSGAASVAERLRSTSVDGLEDDAPPSPPMLPNPFVFLAKALALQDLVGSSSDDG